MTEDKTFERLSLLYQENAKVAAIFWEWRNKIITYFFTATVALFALSGWFFQQQFGRLIFAPLFFGFILSIVSILLDRRNEEILRECYRVGKDIEDELSNKENIENQSSKVKKEIFNSIGTAHNKKGLHKIFTYTWTLRIAYGVVGLMLLALSGLALRYPIGATAQQAIGDISTIERLSRCLCKSD